MSILNGRFRTAARRFAALSASLLLVALVAPATSAADQPLDSGPAEKIQFDLVVLDASNSDLVTDLAIDEFDLTIDDWVGPPATLGVACESSVVRARLFLLRPRSAGSWDVMVVVGFELARGDGPDPVVAREFVGVFRDGSKMVKQFDRRISLRLPESEASRPVTFIQPIAVKPGNYELTVTVSDPAAGQDCTTVPIDVPAIPKGTPFIVGPIVGRRAEAALVVTAGSTESEDRVGRPGSFEPLLASRIGEPQDLLALTQVCQVGGHKRDADDGVERASVHRELTDQAGNLVGALPPVPLELEGTGRVRCQNLLDVLPLAGVGNGGYMLDVRILSSTEIEQVAERRRFDIGSPDGNGAADALFLQR